MEDLLFVKTFGGFSIEYKGITISDQDNRSKKLWTLIEYIMINHKNDLTITSMIELLWPNDTDSASPMNALKVCLHRSREILNRLNYPAKDLIVHKHNSVFWNKNIPLQLDCEQFEYYCKQAEQTILSADEKINLYEKAFALYHGDFLPKNCEDDWVLPITSYYHTLYITSVQKFLSILYTNHYYEKMVTYAYQAARIEEYNENIQYYLILGLHCSGNNQAALSQYEHIIKLLYNDFGVNPSEDLKQLYLRIIKENNTPETDLNIIQQTLKEKETQPRSYECDYAIFEHLYQIQARSMERTGLTFFLCLITLT
ncbi:MAG: BTAD domain-containing putative transcriptional regulator, partial [Clostridiales bacterium]|nr:BTAD domain-containing putative transcriptional regulator [Clostridiales bacterium]